MLVHVAAVWAFYPCVGHGRLVRIVDYCGGRSGGSVVPIRGRNSGRRLAEQRAPGLYDSIDCNRPRKIGADFERRTGRKLNVTTDLAVRMVRRINDGEPFDFLSRAGEIDELIKAGKSFRIRAPTSPARASALLSAPVRPDRTSVPWRRSSVRC